MISSTLVSVDRQRWEDRVNSGFGPVRSTERVCFHANCTERLVSNLIKTECDYCPAYSVAIAPSIPVPCYFHDPDPLFLPVKA